jgi:hypothetical protein
MESKFLKICESLRKKINEQQNTPVDNQSTAPETSAPSDNSSANENQQSQQPEVNLTDKLPSELPVATNEEIINLVQSIKNFYADNKKLEDKDIEELKNLDLTVSDKNIKNLILKLTNKFSPMVIDTNPENIKDSRYN